MIKCMRLYMYTAQLGISLACTQSGLHLCWAFRLLCLAGWGCMVLHCHAALWIPSLTCVLPCRLVCLLVCLFVCLFVGLFVYLSVYLFVCLLLLHRPALCWLVCSLVIRNGCCCLFVGSAASTQETTHHTCGATHPPAHPPTHPVAPHPLLAVLASCQVHAQCH